MFSEDAQVAAIQAAEIAEKGWEILLEEGKKDDRKLKEIVQFIGLLDQRGIDREISADASVFGNYESALEAIGDQNYSELRGFFQGIEQVVGQLARDIETGQIEVEKGKKLGEGLTDEVYEIGRDKVLRVSDAEIKNSEQPLSSKLSKLKFDCIPDEVNVPKIHEVGAHNGFRARIEEKAPGAPLHEYDESYSQWTNRLETLANAPQEHYDKLIEDAERLEEYGLTADDSNADNVFYDEEKGFTLVDIHSGREPNLSNIPKSFVVLATAVNYPSLNDWEIEESDLDNLCRIHHKLRKAGDPYKDDFDRRMALKSYPQADISEEQKPPEPETRIEMETEAYSDNLPDDVGDDVAGYDDFDLEI